MGYCPQFDGLIEQMTGTETLRMFARLRGVKEANIPACIKNLGRMLHFATHLDKECGKYRYNLSALLQSIILSDHNGQ